MTIGYGLLIAALAAALIILAIRNHLRIESMDAIRKAFEARLQEDTNVLIDLPTRDRHARALANSIVAQLKILRAERARYQQGDREIKEAVTNISHDLRTPLTAIYGYLDLMKGETDPETTRRYLALIRNRADAMKQLTEELFHYSLVSVSDENENLIPVCVNDILTESLVSLYTPFTRRSVFPIIDIPDEKVMRVLNPSNLARVFGNILSNALKYSDGDLTVTMRTDGVISFENTASRLDSVSVGRLFDRFYTVETARNATGLGLSIARLLTERMHGTINAEYAQGKLIITIFLPESKKPA